MKPATCAVAAMLISACSLLRGAGAIQQKFALADDLNDIEDLHKQYYNIFKHGNRNAASHLWSKYLLDRSHEMTHEKLSHLFTGFCAVSGSPVQPQDRTRYRVSLDKVGGGKHTGLMFHCCWPCTCDAKDLIRVDTKNITISGGESRQYHFAVIGNPCNRPEELEKPFTQPGSYGQTESTTLKQVAPEVTCDQNGNLEGAHLSDNGHVILSMFHDDDALVGGKAMEENAFVNQCSQRASQGYISGMGEIFRKVAAISPVDLKPAAEAATGQPSKQ